MPTQIGSIIYNFNENSNGLSANFRLVVSTIGFLSKRVGQSAYNEDLGNINAICSLLNHPQNNFNLFMLQVQMERVLQAI